MKLINNIKIKNKINLWKFILLFLPPIILCWPIINGTPFIFKIYLIIPNNQHEINPASERQVSISGKVNSIANSNLITKILKTEILPVSLKICLDNKNQITENNQNKVSPQQADGVFIPQTALVAENIFVGT